MAFCTHCGKHIPDEAVVCLGCGCAVNKSATVARVEEGRVSAGWFWLGFFLPMVGLILYLVWHDDKPICAKKCGKGALIGVITIFVLSILYVIFIIILFVAASQASLLLL